MNLDLSWKDVAFVMVLGTVAVLGLRECRQCAADADNHTREIRRMEMMERSMSEKAKDDEDRLEAGHKRHLAGNQPLGQPLKSEPISKPLESKPLHQPPPGEPFKK